MNLFLSIAVKWKTSLEYVLEQNITVIWKFLELHLSDEDKNTPTEEELLEDLNEGMKASFRAQERVRQIRDKK